MKNFAQLNDNNIIVKTVVADSLEWCIETYGGKWIDITDTNCGIGKIYDALKNVCVLPLEDDRHVVSGNIFIRKMPLNKEGDKVPGHYHNFDHTTLFLKGSFLLRQKNEQGVISEGKYTAPDHLLIKSNVRHEIIALEDDCLFWCVFSHRNANGEVQQEAGLEEIPYI